MANIEFGIQATIIGISAVFVVLMVVSIVMMTLRKVESRVLSRLEGTSDDSSSMGGTQMETFDDLTTDEKLLAITAVDVFRSEQALSESETLAAIGAVLEDQQRNASSSDHTDRQQNV
jgi:Na+-transporting methylmalonyl-CoA/oxaloacetate decarboxylase gamma subunit